MSNIDITMISTILLLISLGVVIYAFISGKKLYSFMMKILITFIILSSCVAQEESTNESFIFEQRPFVVPEGIIDGTKVLENEVRLTIDYITDDDLWRQSAYWFLYGDANVSAKGNIINETNNTIFI